MLPTREEAMALIRDGLSNNPGPWGKHIYLVCEKDSFVPEEIG